MLAIAGRLGHRDDRYVAAARVPHPPVE